MSAAECSASRCLVWNRFRRHGQLGPQTVAVGQQIVEVVSGRDVPIPEPVAQHGPVRARNRIGQQVAVRQDPVGDRVSPRCLLCPSAEFISISMVPRQATYPT